MLVRSAVAQELVPLPPQPEGVAWPTEGWEMGELPEDIAADVQAHVDDAMSRELADELGETRAVVIIHHGKLVLEAYRDGFGPDTKQVSWSMAKSITSALTGRAVQLGLIEDIDYPMPSPFAEDDPRSEITWRQWLTMTDGLDYLEIGAETMDENDVIQMTYGPGRYDVIQYIVDELPPAHEPGVHWNYSTAGFHLIAWALQEFDRRFLALRGGAGLSAASAAEISSLNSNYGKCVSNEDQNGMRCDRSLVDSENVSLQALATRRMDLWLFDALGMDAQPEFDAAGTFLGGSLVWASARDFAKFGYLYLRDGVWEGERLLPEGWVDFSRTGAQGDDGNVYGAGWWITTYGEDPAPEYQLRNAPPWDSFAAEGHEGQTLYVVPSRDLVIVRLGLMPNGGNNWPALFQWNQTLASMFPETRFASTSGQEDAQ
ncbi:serine hydrolase [Henriciella sp. AS95]|uniref:serine hydrolase domain-containing protein n=1 Tax=Henriciella sp. AS95 TaxID=3135782 RepID=UPI003181F3AC